MRKGTTNKVPNPLTEGANRFWYGYLSYAHRDELPPEESWPWAQTLSNNAFKAGARWAIRSSSDLAPHIAKFIEMLILLGMVESDEQFFPAARVPIEPVHIPVEYQYHNEEFPISELRDDIPF